MAMEYRIAIDDVTANKSLKLRKYELDDEDWEVLSDLIHVLKVRIAILSMLYGSQSVDL